MKRPEGFDPARRPVPPARPASPPTPPMPRTRKPAGTASPVDPSMAATERIEPLPKTGRPPAAPKVVHQAAKSDPEVPEYSAKAEARAAAHAAREARRELTRAARARRKFERGESRRFTRRSRNRKVTAGVLAGLFVLLAGMLAVAVYSPILALREVSVDGASQLDESEIRAAVDDQLGTPLALVDFDRITRNLGKIPLVRSYVTETIPPDTIVIHIVERQVVGVVKDGTVWNQVDAAGVVLESSTEMPSGYPQISVTGVAKGNAAFTEATSVLLALPEKLRGRVAKISASTDFNVTFTLKGKSAQKVVWGNAERSVDKASHFADLYKSNKSYDGGTYNLSSPDSPVFNPNL